MRLIIGLAIVGLIVLTGYSAWVYKAPAIQADVDERARRSLAEALPTSSLSVETDGRHVLVRGYADSEENKQAALSRIGEVRGALGPLDEIIVLPKASPYRLTAVRPATGQVVLSGAAPGIAQRDLVVELAADLFGAAQVRSDLDLAVGAPPGNWTGAVATGLSGLLELNEGRLELVDSGLSLSGVAADQAAWDRVGEVAERLPAGFIWSQSVEVLRPQVSPFTFEVVKRSENLEVSGFAPDDASRLAIQTAVAELSGDRMVVGEVSLADGLPSEVPWAERVSLGLSALGLLREGRLSIADGRLRLEGTATPEEKAAFDAVIADQPDVETAVTLLLETVNPFRLTAVKTPEGELDFSGAVPGEAERAVILRLAGDLFGADWVSGELSLADGVPAGAWTDAVSAGLIGLGMLREGWVEIVDYGVRLEGVVPDQATLAELAAISASLPEGYDWSEQLSLVPPAAPVPETSVLESPTAALESDAVSKPTPSPVLDQNADLAEAVPYLNLALSVEDGVALDAVLPGGLEPEEAADALGLATGYRGEVEDTGPGDLDLWRSALTAIGRYLPEFERVEVELSDGRAMVTGETLTMSDVALVKRGLVEGLQDGWQPRVTVVTTGRLYADGEERINPLTGVRERHRGGFWLPLARIDAAIDTCRDRTAEILARRKITFLTNEARLDATARASINEIAAVVLGCLEAGPFQLEIGGHTDATGEGAANQRLSEERAAVVVRALEARGVAAESLKAVGYGESAPIADNATVEGRAANRRITVAWTLAVEQGAEQEGGIPP